MRTSQLLGRSRLRALQSDTQEAGAALDVERGRFQALANPGSKPAVFSSFNLFPTPAPLADRLAELAEVRSGQVILEPSAGLGNLIAAVGRRRVDVRFTAVEIDPYIAERLKTSFMVRCAVHCADFLTWESPEQFDRVIMNPPFKQGRDIKHILRAASMLAPGGRLVSICYNGPRQREQLQPIASAWHDLPDGSFRGEGTDAATAIIVIDSRRAPLRSLSG